MSVLSKPYTFTAGATIVAAEHNSNFDTLYNGVNGNLGDTNISSSEPLGNSKISAITTAGKVSGASFTNLASIPAGAGIIPSANLSAVFPTGIICMWSGTIANIPATWSLCDGTSGTPNLTDKFVVGAGSSYAVGAMGGEATHTLTTAEMPVHKHNIFASTADTPPGDYFNSALSHASDGSTGFTVSSSVQNAGSGGAHENRPPYYALAYIMKL